MSITTMGALRVADRPGWAKKVKQAMKVTSGGIPEAAEALGVTARTLLRWLNEPELAGVTRAPVGLRRDRIARVG